jgi:hypothetical protein
MCTLYINIKFFLHNLRKQYRSWLFRLGCIFHPSWHYLNHSSICTTGKILIVGNVYTYKESGNVDIVRVLDVYEDGLYIYCTLYFFNENKIITVDQRLDPDDYIIWQIMDNSEFDEIMSRRLDKLMTPD